MSENHLTRPLFLRIFLVMLVVVLGAQALNFAILLLVRLPEPPVYRLDEVAGALREGRDSEALRVAAGEPPPEAAQDPRDRRIGAAMASRLGVPAHAVRIRISKPPLAPGDWWLREPGAMGRPVPPDGRGEAPPAGREPGMNQDLVVGRFAAALLLPDGRWRVAAPKETGLEPWQWTALAWLFGTVLLAAPFAWILARRAAAPITLFSRAADRIGRDPNAASLSEEAPTELKPAIAALNEMHARLKRYVDDRTTLVAAIAHDLRTPLMRLTLILEDVDEPARGASRSEIREMSDRIDAALAFVRGVAIPAKRKRLNLRSLVESVVSEMEDGGADVELVAGPQAVVDADVGGIRSMIVNLLANAVRYAGSARVALHRDDGHVRLEVSDDGPGIPEAEIERVFEPFHRVESSRSRETGGTGLGLASARAVARAHGGDVVLRNRPQGGLTVEAILPISKPV